jgi:hypothetical protein
MSEHVERPGSDLHTLSIAAIIPLIQALLTGLVLSILAFAAALTFGKPKPWLWLLWGFLLPTAGMWLISVKRWFKLTDWLPNLEQWTKLDLNRDGQIGRLPSVEVAPEPKRMTVTVRDVRDGMFLHMNHYELPVSEDQLRAFALGVGQGLSLAEANWIGPAHPFTRDEYRAFRGELIRRRWVELSNHKSANQGFQMTRAGEAVMREIAKSPSPTVDLDA